MCTIQLLSRRKEPKVYLCHTAVRAQWRKGLFDLAVVLMQRNRFLWRGFYLIPYSRRRLETWLIWGLLPMHKKEKRRGNWHSNASPINFTPKICTMSWATVSSLHKKKARRQTYRWCSVILRNSRFKKKMVRRSSLYQLMPACLLWNALSWKV